MYKVFFLILTGTLFTSCHQTDLNRFIITDGNIKIYRLTPIVSPSNYVPQLTHQLVDITKTEAFNDTSRYLGMIELRMTYVSDNSVGCIVPYEGFDGRMDSIVSILNLATKPKGNHPVVSLSSFSDINDLNNFETGRLANEEYKGFSYLIQFHTIESIISDYNTNNHKCIDKIIYPLLLSGKEVKQLVPNQILLKTDHSVIKLRI
jgi:hypothetical protein